MTNAPSVDVLNAARRNANRVRASALMEVADGLIHPVQYLERAATAEGRPLRRTSLFQLLQNQPGWGRGKAEDVIREIASINQVRPDVRALTVGWAIEYRTHGRRYLSVVDRLPRQTPPVPWPGFPFSARTKP